MMTVKPGTEGAEAVSATLQERLCSVAATAAEQDPIGSGGTVTRLLAVEIPTPWTDGFYEADAQGTVQQRMRAVQMDSFARLRAAGQALPASGYPALYGIAPDREWSRPDQRRVLLATRPTGAMANFAMTEYVFPAESPALVELVRAYYEDAAALAAFDRYRAGPSPYREFFVCTHGHVDICCATFGVPLYRQARAAFPAVRAWRMTHFGGHRFAPTAWEFPSGYKWAFLDEAATRQVIARDGDATALAGKLRGWSGVPSQVQLLDREGLIRKGWRWLNYQRAGEIVEADEAACRWHVWLSFAGDGERGVYEGVVAVGRELRDAGCGPHWGEREHLSPEYRLESVREA